MDQDAQGHGLEARVTSGRWRRFSGAILLGATIVFAFDLVLLPPLDPDLGWHLRSGAEIVRRGGVPRADWFSWTMPEYRWVDHEWLSEVAMHGLFVCGGYFALALGFAALALAAFWLTQLPQLATPGSDSASGEAVLPAWQRPLQAIFGGILCGPFLGARPQLVTLLGFALVLALMHRRWRGAGWIWTSWALPPLFLLWANLHAGVVFGLAALCWLTLVEWGERRDSSVPRQHPSGWLVLALAAAATFVNPYGWRLYEEVFRTLADSGAQSVVAEWQSPSPRTLTGLAFALVLAIVIELLAWGRRRLDLATRGLLIGTMLMGLASVRHLPLFYLVALPLLASFVPRGAGSAVFKIQFAAELRLGAAAVLVTLLATQAHVPLVWRLARDQAGHWKHGGYPVAAANALTRVASLAGGPRRLFNAFNWGGYLVWRGVPVFVDGRMTHWRMAEKSAFRESLEISRLRRDWRERLSSAGVDAVLIETESPLAQALRLLPDWQVAYEDANAILFTGSWLEERRP